MSEDALRDFCRPYYKNKDTMHDLSHVDRLLTCALEMCRNYLEADIDTIVHGAYFHGMVKEHDEKIKAYLASLNFSEVKTSRILKAAYASLIEETPTSLEEKILHDAHLLEGGKTFIIAKSLVNGTARGQTLIETIGFIEKNILGKGKIYLEENKNAFEEKQAYAKDFIDSLKKYF